MGRTGEETLVQMGVGVGMNHTGRHWGLELQARQSWTAEIPYSSIVYGS